MKERSEFPRIHKRDENRRRVARLRESNTAQPYSSGVCTPHSSTPAVFLSREIVVRRFIYARSAKFTGCVAGAALINHTESALNVPGVRSTDDDDDSGGGAFPSLFHRPTTKLYPSLTRERSICQATRSGKRMLKNAIWRG